jgi:hypothetical protein
MFVRAKTKTKYYVLDEAFITNFISNEKIENSFLMNAKFKPAMKLIYVSSCIEEPTRHTTSIGNKSQTHF